MPIGQGYTNEAKLNGPSERCKPDYEAMIKRLQLRRAATDGLLTAFYGYFDVYGYPCDGSRERNFTAELIGILEMDSKTLFREFERLMAEAEKEG